MLLPLAFAIVPRLWLIFFRYMQPFLIHSVSRFVAQPVTDYTTNKGWGLTAAYGLVYIGMTFSTAIYYHQTYRTIAMVRGALITSIYAKAVKLPSTALDEVAAVTLMSTDVQRICDALEQLHEVWAGILEIGIGIWLLTRQIGIALLGPLGITIAAVFATLYVSNLMGPAQKIWMEAIQARLSVTAKILESMKGVKMLGLTPIVSRLLQRLRMDEISQSLRFRRLLAICITLGNLSIALGPGIAFVIYITAVKGSDQKLDVSRAFTALSLISLVSVPVKNLIFAVPPLMASLGCIDRVQAFLRSKTWDDHRIVLGPKKDVTGRPATSSVTGDQGMELQAMQSTMSTIPEERPPVRLLNASFSWNATNTPVIQDVSLELAPGSLTFVIGSVGTGKTTLLKSVLGEIPSRKGFVYIDAPQAAFVQQTPWIQHKTFRDNIIGTSLFDQSWYNTVLHTCALSRDISQLPAGDLTIVGSAGHSLSGGQKQRLVSSELFIPNHELTIPFRQWLVQSMPVASF